MWNILVSDLDVEIEWTLNEFANDIKVGAVTPEVMAGIQETEVDWRNDLQSIKCNSTRTSAVLHLKQNNCVNKCSLGNAWLSCSIAQKDVGFIEDNDLSMSQY